MIGDIWKDSSIQELFKKNRYDFHIFDNLDKVAPPKYTPTHEDILRCRRKTTGLVQTSFVYKNLKFNLHDVGGQRSERKKWASCSEGVTALLFVASTSEYDQKCYEDDLTNRMQESLSIFSEQVNGNFFKEIPVIILLNKIDVFKEKMKVKDLSSAYPEYTGGSDVEKGLEFIRQEFRNYNTHKKDRIHFFVTQATDRDGVKETLDKIKELIVELQSTK